MKQDKLKIYIEQNREAFDAAMPGPYGWGNLTKALNRYAAGDAVERALLTDRLMLDNADVPESLWAAINKELDERCADPLERFIAENRSEFDAALPPIDLWSDITKSLPAAEMTVIKGNKSMWPRQLMRAAAAIAIVAAALFTGIWYGRSTAAEAMAMSQVSPEYAELEQFYQRQIDHKKARLVSMGGSQPAVVLADIEQLDRLMGELQQELANVPPGNREQVVRAMIENYKAKTAILERVLERLENTQPDTSYRKPYQNVQTL